MNILVTGADGFIGKNMAEKLEEHGHDVIRLRAADGDIVEEETLERCSLKIDAVYHFAARTFVPDSWVYGYDYFRVNVMGTVSVLEFCRKKHCAAVLMSSYVYGQPQNLPVREDHPVSAVTPYHETKVIMEHIAKFYSEKYAIPVTVFRPFNVYGYGQNENFLLPQIMKQLTDPQILEIKLMDLSPKRDYVYIKDVTQALSCALSVKSGYHVYNIGTGKSYSVEEVIKACIEVTGIQKMYRAENKVRAAEVSDCRADISRLKQDFDYVIQYTLMDGIRDWYGQMENFKEKE